MLSDLMETSETQKRISARHRELLGDIGVLDWQMKQLQAQVSKKYDEIEAMLREQPFIQQLELDLIHKYRLEQAAALGPKQAMATGVSQSETSVAPEPPGIPVEDLPRPKGPRARTPAGRMFEAKDAVERAPARSRKRVARELTGAKRPTKKAVTKRAKDGAPSKPATGAEMASPAPVKRGRKPAPAAEPARITAEAVPLKRGRGRPRKQPVAAPPPEVGSEVESEVVEYPGNGAHDLDAAFSAM